jgi:hypothetical protein
MPAVFLIRKGKTIHSSSRGVVGGRIAAVFYGVVDNMVDGGVHGWSEATSGSWG